jgi:hypothetical protein
MLIDFWRVDFSTKIRKNLLLPQWKCLLDWKRELGNAMAGLRTTLTAAEEQQPLSLTSCWNLFGAIPIRYSLKAMREQVKPHSHLLF